MSNQELPFVNSNNLAKNIEEEAQSRIDFAYDKGYAERDAEIKAQLAAHPLAPLLILAKNLVIEIINHWVAVSLPEAPASATLKGKSPDGGDWLLTTRNHKLGPIIVNIPKMEKRLIKGGWKLGNGGSNGYKAPPPPQATPSAVPNQPQPISNGHPQPIPVARQAAGGVAGGPPLPPGNELSYEPIAQPNQNQEHSFKVEFFKKTDDGKIKVNALGPSPLNKFGVPLYEVLGASGWDEKKLATGTTDVRAYNYTCYYILNQNGKPYKATRLVQE